MIDYSETAGLTAYRASLYKRRDCSFAGLDAVVMGPTNPKAVLIVLHGMGDNKLGWLNLTETIFGDLDKFLQENTTIIYLEAPLRQGQGESFEWFRMDIPAYIGYTLRNSTDRVARLPYEGVLQSEQTLVAAVNEIYDKYNVNPRSVILQGFSQGGAMTTRLITKMPNRPQHAIVLSGFLTDLNELHRHMRSDRMSWDTLKECRVHHNWGFVDSQVIGRQNTVINQLLRALVHDNVTTRVEYRNHLVGGDTSDNLDLVYTAYLKEIMNFPTNLELINLLKDSITAAGDHFQSSHPQFPVLPNKFKDLDYLNNIVFNGIEPDQLLPDGTYAPGKVITVPEELAFQKRLTEEKKREEVKNE